MSANWGGQRREGGGVCIQPTEHGLPPTMLKPRDPPSRRRTTVTLLASPSYGQTEERHAGQRHGKPSTGSTGNTGTAVIHLFNGRAGARARKLQTERVKR